MVAQEDVSDITRVMDNRTRDKILPLLDRLANHHKPTYDHSIRVAYLARGLGEIQNRDPKAGIYAILHDIGKINTPIEILSKTEGFDEKDMAIIREHVVDGYTLLSEKGLFFSSWIALTHHRFQPRFYPSDVELANFQFPIIGANPSSRLLADTWASIVSIADAYDAAQHRRNEKFDGKILPPEELKKWLLTHNPSSQRIIEVAYSQGIFSLEFPTA